MLYHSFPPSSEKVTLFFSSSWLTQISFFTGTTIFLRKPHRTSSTVHLSFRKFVSYIFTVLIDVVTNFISWFYHLDSFDLAYLSSGICLFRAVTPLSLLSVWRNGFFKTLFPSSLWSKIFVITNHSGNYLWMLRGNISIFKTCYIYVCVYIYVYVCNGGLGGWFASYSSEQLLLS